MSHVKTKSPVVLGIDPGYDRVGWAVGKKNSNSIDVLGYGLIQTKASDDLFLRYQQIQQELVQVIEKHKPSICAIEKLFFSKNKTTALKVSEARGVIIITAIQHGLTIQEYGPNTIKLSVTGHGAADKQAVTKMVKMQLKLKEDKINDDAIDALAVVLTACLVPNFDIV